MHIRMAHRAGPSWSGSFVAADPGAGQAKRDPVPELSAVFRAGTIIEVSSDLDPNGDPLHLVIARSEARHPDAAVALAEALFAEASARGDRARDLFARAEKIRGVPESLRTLRKITRMTLL